MTREYVPGLRAGDKITIWVFVCERMLTFFPPIFIEEENVFGKFVPVIVIVSPPFFLSLDLEFKVKEATNK